MTDLSIPGTIVTLLDATRTQIDVITMLSSGGAGVIILTWARILGIFDHADFSSFKKPDLLTAPTIFLIIAVIIGYLAGAQTTGYYTEIASGLNSTTGKAITAARDYCFASYDAPIFWMMAVQFYTSVLGIILLAG